MKTHSSKAAATPLKHQQPALQMSLQPELKAKASRGKIFRLVLGGRVFDLEVGA